MAQASSSSPGVRWRLPTSHDYDQAEVDGIRFVLPDMLATGGTWEWSATIFSDNRANALAFDSGAAQRAVNGRNDYLNVRCVGR